MYSVRMLFRRMLLLAVLTIPTLGVAAEEQHFPTSDDLRHLKAIGGPQLSPDGKLVLVTITDSTADGAKSHLWLVATGGAEKPRQLTFSPPAEKRGERNPQWAPDGNAIYFLAHRGEQTQIFRLSMNGGEAAPYELKIVPVVDQSKDKNAIPPPGAEKKDGEKPAEPKDADKKSGAPEQVAIDVAGYVPSPDGKWLAVWAKDPETPGEKKQKDAKADAVWVNHEAHMTRLYLASLKPDGSIDGALKPVGVEPDVQRAAWTEAADRLLVITEKPNDESDLGPANAAWIVDVASPDKAVKLNAIPATVGGAAWSPDGGEILFSAQTPEDAPPGYDELFRLPRENSGSAIVPLSNAFAGQINAAALYFLKDGGIVFRPCVKVISLSDEVAEGSSSIGESPEPVEGTGFVGAQKAALGGMEGREVS